MQAKPWLMLYIALLSAAHVKTRCSINTAGKGSKLACLHDVTGAMPNPQTKLRQEWMALALMDR